MSRGDRFALGRPSDRVNESGPYFRLSVCFVTRGYHDTHVRGFFRPWGRIATIQSSRHPDAAVHLASTEAPPSRCFDKDVRVGCIDASRRLGNHQTTRPDCVTNMKDFKRLRRAAAALLATSSLVVSDDVNRRTETGKPTPPGLCARLASTISVPCASHHQRLIAPCALRVEGAASFGSRRTAIFFCRAASQTKT
jgi:hypothetical protein